VQIRILGPVDAIDGLRPVALGGRKQRALLARLALDAGRTVAVDRLVDDLWGDDAPETAAKMVQIAVSRLRKVLPEGVLVTRAPGYALEVDPEAIDLTRFTRLRGEARAALASGDPELAARRGREALELWRGPALEELPEPFARTETAHLEEMRLTCLADCIDADLARGRHADAVAEIEALVAHHPLRERLRGLQMTALYRSGRQADALEAYQRFRKLLDDELGLVPSVELQALNDRMIRQDAALMEVSEQALGAAEPADEPEPVAAAPDPPPEPAPTPAPAERRQLSVLVAELADETVAGLDAEEAHGRVSAFQQAAERVVRELGGHAAQQHGSSIVAYFGWPQAHEDCALRAVRAALRLAEETEARAAVDTGVAVVGGDAFGAVGPTVTGAQRLVASAPSRGVLVGAGTEALVRGWVDMTRRDADTFVLEDETGVRSSLELAHARGLTPMVGREPELYLLHERWRRAAAGAGQVVFVSGEPGVGKSRLVDSLARRIEEDRPERLTLRCSAERQTTTLHAVHDVLGPAMPRDDDMDRLLETLAETILQRSDRAPLLLVIEDLHWSDPSTLELLGLLLRRVPPTSVLLVATFRPEFRPGTDGAGHTTQLTLARFDRAESLQMIGSLLKDREVSPALADRIAERTDGVPLFIEEAVRELQESGALDDDRVDVSIPATLHDSLMGRLDRLGDAKEVAQTAALIARQFPTMLLEAVVPGGPARVRPALERLVDAGILYEVGRPRGQRYLFKHALVQEAAYDSLLQSTRQELHARVAAVLEERFEELVVVEPECIARHLTAAGRGPEAVPHWLRAGEQALAVSAYPEAATHLESGLGVVVELPDERARDEAELKLQLRLGAARMASEGYSAPATRSAFERAELLSRTHDEPGAVGGALYGLVTYYVSTAQQRRARELGGRLREVAERARDPEMAMEADVLLGAASFLIGRLQEARAHLDRALTQWDLDVHRDHTFSFGQEPGVVAHAMRSMTMGWLGDVAEARRSGEQARATARAVDHPLSLAYALAAAALVEQELDDVDRVDELAREMIVVTDKARMPVWHAWSHAFSGWVLMRRGELERGTEQALQGLNEARAGGFLTTQAHLIATLADAHLRADPAAPPPVDVDDALELVGPEGEPTYAPTVHRVRGAALLQGNPRSVQAEASLRRALASAEEMGAALPGVRAASALAALLRARGRGEEARTLLTRALDGIVDADGAPAVAEAEAALAANAA
jgi:DNA-binding SARP family transcriptional activator